MPSLWGITSTTAKFAGQWGGSVVRGFVLGFTQSPISEVSIDLPKYGINPSDEGKQLIEIALKSGNENQFVKTVDTVCENESLDCTGLVSTGNETWKHATHS